MKITKVIVLLLTMSMMFFMFGCGDDDDGVNEFEVLTEYLEGTDGGYINNMGSWIMSESSVTLTDYLVLDLRASTDFDAMHIDDAINVTMTTMFDEAANATKPILVTCYSGQSASFAHMLLRLKGYEAYVMKFGMSLHDESLDEWTSNCSSAYVADFVTTASLALPSFDYPELSTGYETAEEILDDRVEDAIAAWPTLITAANVMSDPSAYNIINYWPENHYLSMGHIVGAYQVTPSTLTIDQNLSVFDPAGTNVFYCYTGQTAAAACAYLTILGYDVKSIEFGTNAMIHDVMTDSKWPGY